MGGDSVQKKRKGRPVERVAPRPSPTWPAHLLRPVREVAPNFDARDVKRRIRGNVVNSAMDQVWAKVSVKVRNKVRSRLANGNSGRQLEHVLNQLT